MKSDRTQRRPSIVLCVAAALLATAPASTVRAADRDDWVMVGASDTAAQRLQLGVGQSVIFDLPEEAGEISSAIPTSPTRSCAPRNASTFPASPMARRAFSRWPGTGEDRGHPSLGRARRRRVVEPA